MMRLLTIALEVCRITAFAGRPLRGCGSFTLASGINRFYSTLLPTVQGGRRMLTRRGVFVPARHGASHLAVRLPFPSMAPPAMAFPKETTEWIS